MGIELVGVGVSAGIAIGPALIVERDAAPVFRLALGTEEVDGEITRLASAVEHAREQLQAVRERLRREAGVPHAYIFDAQLLMLEDPLLLGRAVAIISQERVNAEWALRLVSEQLHELFDAFTDEYLKERSTDLDDVLGRVQLNLRGSPGAPSLACLPGPVVLIAADLAPSEAVELDWKKVLAVATDAGSSTYHTAIIARSLGIPAVAGLRDATRRIRPGQLVAVDGTSGIIAVDPSGPALLDLRARQETERIEEERLRETRHLSTITQDGVCVRLLANAEFPGDAATAALYGAEGIGLFRSEYLLGRSREWPSEEKQIDVYRGLLDVMRPHPVTVRTWDVGPDDISPGEGQRLNPALGERALRLLRRAPELFLTQLRALLRAALHGPLHVMFPFAAGPGDLRVALALVAEAKDSLRREQIDYCDDMPIGLTIEVPSAAATIDLLARDVEFLSVGTNDLIQYLLAVDRSDPRVASLYQPLHPAVLRTIRRIVEVADARGIPVSLCGEMASEPLTALALVGLGVRTLSMTPTAIPRVKAAIRAARASVLESVALESLDLDSPEEIVAALRTALAETLATD